MVWWKQKHFLCLFLEKRMELLSLLVWIVVLYLVAATLVFWSLTNNVFVFRPKNYTIPFGKEGTTQFKKMLLPEKIRYWRCENPNQLDGKWAVLLHSWGRNAARMVTRGKVYWKRGYSLIFVDAWSHGQSKYKRRTTALWYAQHTMKICKEEGIETPVVHGLSFGAIAATVVAANTPCRALVAEALFRDIEGMYEGFFRMLHLPKPLFWWEVRLIMRAKFPWDKLLPANNLPKITCPIFLIHGAEDDMFPPEETYDLNRTLLKETDWCWLVDGSLHSKMEHHPDYFDKLGSFLEYVDSKEIAILPLEK